MNKHRIVGFIVLVALVVISVQFFLTYQRAKHPLQAYRSPPIAPLTANLTTPNNAPSVQSAETIMEKDFDGAPDIAPAVPAWIVQVASLSNESAAQILLAQLKALGFDAYIFPFTLQDKQSFRVCVGPFTEQSLAVSALSTVQEKLKITGILKQYIPGDVKEVISQ